MNSLANHQASMQHKHRDHGMELKRRAFEPQAERHLRERPALVHPVCHNLHHDKRHGDRRALEVLRFAGCVLGHHGDGHVEAREAGEAAEHEEREQDVIDGRAETEAECGGCGGDTKGYLYMSN